MSRSFGLGEGLDHGSGARRDSNPQHLAPPAGGKLVWLAVQFPMASLLAVMAPTRLRSKAVHPLSRAYPVFPTNHALTIPLV